MGVETDGFTPTGNNCLGMRITVRERNQPRFQRAVGRGDVTRRGAHMPLSTCACQHSPVRPEL